MMRNQGYHAMLPENTHDESARQVFVSSMKLHLAGNVSLRLRDVYETRVKPEFVHRHGTPPKDRHDVSKAMVRDPHYQMWSSLQRTSQEMKQDAQCAVAFRQIGKLAERARKFGARAKRGGLRVNPSLAIPRYVAAVDVHCLPGGYHNELIEEDVLPGAVYDPGVFLYSMGRMGAYNEDIGETVLAYIKDRHPGFQPTAVLDMGCAVGHSTVPYASAFPDAPIHAIDVAAPLVRYGHARAESLGVGIHFSQQNAEQTDFEDESFDLIVSHILLHETSAKALRNILRECHRLLRPDGLMVHAETPQYAGMAPYDAFILDWDTYNNNEPFWGQLHDTNLKELIRGAGFHEDCFFQHMQPSAVAQAQGRTNLFQGGDFGGGGAWFLYGAQK